MTYNVWNKWDPLETVVLGTTYPPEFYQDIKNKKIRSCMQRIAQETHEDLAAFKTVLQDFGCTVLQPELNAGDSILNYIDTDGKLTHERSGVPRAPLEPRNCQFVAGNKIYKTVEDPDIVDILEVYNPADVIDLSNPVEPQDNVHAPNFTIIGRDLYVDQHDHQLQQSQIDQLTQDLPNTRLNLLNIGGHNDACFAPLKPGALLSLRQIQNYSTTFPDWDVCFLPNQSWVRVQGFMKLKDKVNGKWWLPGEEDNDEFTDFVETWLHDWVGYVEETVFDVNCLVLDEHHVCVSNTTPEVEQFFKKHRMEPVYVPWRHRYFWDGGLHCITLDLKRRGTQQDYFPLRQQSVTDQGV